MITAPDTTTQSWEGSSLKTRFGLRARPIFTPMQVIIRLTTGILQANRHCRTGYRSRLTGSGVALIGPEDISRKIGLDFFNRIICFRNIKPLRFQSRSFNQLRRSRQRVFGTWLRLATVPVSSTD